MRKILISILLAGAASTPVFAAPGDYSDRFAARQAARAERQSAREMAQPSRDERQSAREERQSVREERQFQRQPRVEAPVDQASPMASRVPVMRDPRGRSDERQAEIQQRLAQRQADIANRSAERPQGQFQPSQRIGERRDLLQQQRSQRMEQNRARFQQIREARRNAAPPAVSRVPRPDTQPPAPTTSRPTPAPQWSSAWRRNDRYDWSSYRRHHHSLFNLGFYFDPFGWGYYPYQVGWRMWPSYFGSNYWMNDPWQYRLPFAPPGTRWIRYYDDAILVDLWSGQVIDVVYDFFW